MFAALLSASLLAPAAPVPKAAPRYFPTAVGTKWVYERESKETFTEELIEAEEKDGEMRLTVRRSVGLGDKWDDTLKVTKAGVTRLTTGPFDLGVQMLRLPPKEGDEWTFEMPIQARLMAHAGTMTVGKAEKVTVPAGTFEAVPVRITATAANGVRLDAPETSVRWYAAGVGMVKLEYKGGHQVLKEFTPGKGKKEEPKAEKK